MAFFDKDVPQVNRVDTAVSKGTTIAGKISFESGTVLVNGTVDGDITAVLKDDKDGYTKSKNTTIVISRDGVVHGDLYAEHIIIAGQVSGRVHSVSSLSIETSAIIDTDQISYSSMKMEEGAKVTGRLISNSRNPMDLKEEELKNG